MEDEDANYSCGWQNPRELLKMRKLKTKKRALQSRFCFEGDSPSKKSKRSDQCESKGLYFKPNSPPPCELTCDSHDSTLMDLLNLKRRPSTSTPIPEAVIASTKGESPNFSAAFSPASPASASSLTIANNMSGKQISGFSPLRKYLPSYSIVQETPRNFKKRQAIIPAPAPLSPSSWSNSSRGELKDTSTPPKIRPIKHLNLKRKTNTVDIEKSKTVVHKELCLDWSLKTRLLVTSSKPFGWSSNGLKTSEESSGITAFVRCIDIEPGDSHDSQLDTSLGAQFRQCCLYWQHPYLPTVNLFPRETGSIPNTLGMTSSYANIRFEEKVFDSMHSEWIEAFRSAFQLLRTRQCPFFYICANQITCLFCAAGTQGNDQIQIYVTPSTKGFRDALKREGIQYILPYSTHEEAEGNEDEVHEDNDSDDEPGKWLNEIGVSQDLSVSTLTKISPTDMIEEKNKSSLVIIAGNDTLSFFNFLINSKTFLVSSIGPFAGLPPTILGPVAFHGATLRSLKLKQCKVKDETGDNVHTIEMTGPILPHVMHMLCALLSKTVEIYKINLTTLLSTSTLNLNARSNCPNEKYSKPNVFEMQNLSDCGLKKLILEVFCRRDNCDTIKDTLMYKNSLFEWF